MAEDCLLPQVDEANGLMRGVAPEHVAEFAVPLGQGLVGYTALSNNILRCSDARKHPSFSPEYEDYVPDGPCSCICIPVVGDSRPEDKPPVRGVVKVITAEPFPHAAAGVVILAGIGRPTASSCSKPGPERAWLSSFAHSGAEERTELDAATRGSP